MIMACDGLWDVFTSQQAVELVARFLDDHNSPEVWCPWSGAVSLGVVVGSLTELVCEPFRHSCAYGALFFVSCSLRQSD